jgi:Zn-dependent protease/CBS domain-containing protein
MFGKRISLFKLLGFEVGIDWSWIIIAILILWSLSTGFFPMYYKNLSTEMYWMMGLVGAAGLFLSIIFHEFCHSMMARRYGMPMKGITLFIFGGVAQMEDEPPSPKAEFMVAIVGPLSSLAIGLIFYGIYIFGKNAGLPEPVNGVVGYLAFINGILAGFNIIPAFPLDGGRVLRSILWGLKKNLKWATRVSSWIGTGFGILLIVLGIVSVLRGNFVGGMWWLLIGMFLHGAAKSAYQQLIMRKALEGEPLTKLMKTDPVTVPASVSLKEFVEDYVYRHHYKMFPVMDNSNKLAGCITTKQLKEVPKENWDQKKVADLAMQCSPENSVDSKEDAMRALSKMKSNSASRLMVTEGDHLLGIISLKDMLEHLSLKAELEE